MPPSTRSTASTQTPTPTVPSDDLIARGLACSCGHHAHTDPPRRVEADSSGRDDAATQNVTDLRRARQRARATVDGIMSDIQDWLRQQPVDQMMTQQGGQQRVNQALTVLAAKRFNDQLVSWLAERHRIAAGRAARAAFDLMKRALPDDAEDDQLRGQPRVDGTDREWLRQLRQIDVGLLSGTRTAQEANATSDSLASKLGDRLTRQIRLGLDQDETVPQLAERIEYVLKDGDADGRKEAGVTGQTTRSKAELIAHDSVQDAYNTAARKRYLRNGFRFAVYDATIDTKTTDLCRRMNEHVIDMVDTPWFIPPLHPYCRSGIRPILKLDGRTPLSNDDVADGYLQTIMQTKSYRPAVVGQDEFRPTSLSIQHGHTSPPGD